jgi:hypothetical protein
MTKAIARLESGRVCPGPRFEGFEGTGNMGDELNHSPLINPFLITCFVKLLSNNAQSTEIATHPRTFFQGETHWSLLVVSVVKVSRHEREHSFSECCWFVVRRTILARVLFGQWMADLYKPEHEWGRAVFSHQAVNDELIHGIAKLMASV